MALSKEEIIQRAEAKRQREALVGLAPPVKPPIFLSAIEGGAKAPEPEPKVIPELRRAPQKPGIPERAESALTTALKIPSLVPAVLRGALVPFPEKAVPTHVLEDIRNLEGLRRFRDRAKGELKKALDKRIVAAEQGLKNLPQLLKATPTQRSRGVVRAIKETLKAKNIQELAEASQVGVALGEEGALGLALDVAGDILAFPGAAARIVPRGIIPKEALAAQRQAQSVKNIFAKGSALSRAEAETLVGGDAVKVAEELGVIKDVGRGRIRLAKKIDELRAQASFEAGQQQASATIVDQLRHLAPRPVVYAMRKAPRIRAVAPRAEAEAVARIAGAERQAIAARRATPGIGPREVPVPPQAAAEMEALAAKRTVAAEFAPREAVMPPLSRAEQQVLAQRRLPMAPESFATVRREMVDFVKTYAPPETRRGFLSEISKGQTRANLINTQRRVLQTIRKVEAKNLVSDIRRLASDVKKTKNVDVNYQKDIRGLLDLFEMRGPTKARINRIKQVEKRLADLRDRGKDVALPQEVLNELRVLERKPLRDLSRVELRALRDTVEDLSALGRLAVKTRGGLKQLRVERYLREIAEEGATAFETKGMLRPGEIRETLGAPDKARNMFHRLYNRGQATGFSITPMDVVFDMLDGSRGAYSGPNFRLFKKTLDMRWGDSWKEFSTLSEKTRRLAKELDLGDANFRAIGVWAIKKQRGGTQRLLESGEFTLEQINTLKLTPQEGKMYRFMRDNLDAMKPRVQRIARDVYNQPFQEVEGYFPFRVDLEEVARESVPFRLGLGVDFDELGQLVPRSASEVSAITKKPRKGFLEARAGRGRALRNNAMEVFLQHMGDAVYLDHMARDLDTLWAVARSSKYRDLVGDKGQELVMGWLDTMARNGGIQGHRFKFLDTLRVNVGVGQLFFKLSTGMIQFSALANATSEIGHYAFEGAYDLSRSLLNRIGKTGGDDWAQFVLDNMPELAARYGGDPTYRELINSRWSKDVVNAGSLFLRATDSFAANATAIGAYKKYMREAGLPIDLLRPNRDVIERAQLVVRRTQATGLSKDVPQAFSRGTLTGNVSFDRTLLQFQNFPITAWWSRLRHDAVRAGINERSLKQFSAPLFGVLITVSAEHGLRKASSALVRESAEFLSGGEIKAAPFEEDTAWGWGLEVAKNVPFVSSGIGMWVYGGELFPVYDALKKTIKSPQEAITRKTATGRLRATIRATEAGAKLLGVPGAAQAGQLARQITRAQQPPPLSGFQKLRTLPTSINP